MAKLDGLLSIKSSTDLYKEFGHEMAAIKQKSGAEEKMAKSARVKYIKIGI